MDNDPSQGVPGGVSAQNPMTVGGGTALPWLSNLIAPLIVGYGSRRANATNAALMREQMAMQEEFARYGIRWRVEDAKAAGLHPLSALGATPASYTPSVIPAENELSEMGQSIGSAVIRATDVRERAMHQAQMGVLAAQEEKDHAMATYYRSEAFRNAQAAASASPFPSAVVSPQDASSHALQGKVELTPAPQTTHRAGSPSTVASMNPGLQEYVVSDDGTSILLPSSSEGMAESLESIPLWFLPYLLYRNLSRDRSSPARSTAGPAVPLPRNRSHVFYRR